jgi:hypothetical protein
MASGWLCGTDVAHGKFTEEAGGGSAGASAAQRRKKIRTAVPVQ